ncbi:SET and MYND domain-containing protein 4, partial [Pseudolycoriella hygida]
SGTMTSQLWLNAMNVMIRSGKYFDISAFRFSEVFSTMDFVNKNPALSDDLRRWLSMLNELNQQRDRCTDLAKHLLPKLRELLKDMQNGAAESTVQKPMEDTFESKQMIEKFNDTVGRYIVAGEDIKKNDLLYREKAFSFIPYQDDSDPDMILYHCQNCSKATRVPFPCYDCSRVSYCSPQCVDQHKTIHKFECVGYQKNFWSKVEIGHLSWRTFIVGFADAIERLDTTESNPQQILETLEAIHESDFVYGDMLRLHTNIHKMDAYDCLQFALTAQLTVIYLDEWTDFFTNLPQKCTQIMPNIDDWKKFTAAVLLKHLGQVASNLLYTRDIQLMPPSSLSNYSYLYTGGIRVRDLHLVTRKDFIFFGIFPKISLMNHSCDPNIYQIFDGATVSIYASRDIAMNEEIFNCYGPNYKITPRERRQASLKRRHYFNCVCEKCCNNDQTFLKYYQYICPNEECRASIEMNLFLHDWWRDLRNDYLMEEIMPNFICEKCKRALLLNPTTLKGFFDVTDNDLEFQFGRRRKSTRTAARYYIAVCKCLSKHHELKLYMGQALMRYQMQDDVQELFCTLAYFYLAENVHQREVTLREIEELIEQKKFNDTVGRYIVAGEDIKKNDLLYREKAFSFIPYQDDSDPDMILYHCQNCSKATRVPFPCYDCSRVSYCSPQCVDQHKTIHKFECVGYQKNFWSKVEIGHLSWRTFIVGFADAIERLDTTESNPQQILETLEAIHESDFVYGDMLRLHTNIHKMDAYDCLQFALTAQLTVIYLDEWTDFFTNLPQKCTQIMPNIDDWKKFTAAVLLKHLGQVFSKIAYTREIQLMPPSSLSNYSYLYTGGVRVHDLHLVTRKVCIFCGIFPKISLMNHSCDPNIYQIFDGATVSIYASRDIAMNEEIFNCYGPNYKTMPREQRQIFLKRRHYFNCVCEKCCNNDQTFLKYYQYICSNEECRASIEMDLNLWWLDLTNDNLMEKIMPNFICKKCKRLLFLNPKTLKEFFDAADLEFQFGHRRKSTRTVARYYMDFCKCLSKHHQLKPFMGQALMQYQMQDDVQELFCTLAYVATDNYLIARERFGIFSLEFIMAIPHALNILLMAKKIEQEREKPFLLPEIIDIRKTFDVKKMEKTVEILPKFMQTIFKNAIKEVQAVGGKFGLNINEEMSKLHIDDILSDDDSIDY